MHSTWHQYYTLPQYYYRLLCSSTILSAGRIELSGIFKKGLSMNTHLLSKEVRHHLGIKESNHLSYLLILYFQ